MGILAHINQCKLIAMQHVTIGIIKKDGKFLIAKRKAGGVVGGKWEFPGGKIEHNESPQECLKRELKEELAVDVEVGQLFEEHFHCYDNKRQKVSSYSVDCLCTDFNLSEHEEIRWIEASEMQNFQFTGNGRPLATMLSKQPNLSMEIGSLMLRYADAL